MPVGFPRTTFALALALVAAACGGKDAQSPAPPPAAPERPSDEGQGTAPSVAKTTLRQVPVAFERVALSGEPGPDVVLFGEPRPAFLRALRNKVTGASIGARVERSPSGRFGLLFGTRKKGGSIVVVVDDHNVIKGPFTADDAVFSNDDELVVRHGQRLERQPLVGASVPLAATDICAATTCERTPKLLAATRERVLLALQTRGSVTSSSLATIAFADGHVAPLAGLPEVTLGLAARADGLTCTLEVPTSASSAALLCARPPWAAVERVPLPAAGGEPHFVGDDIVTAYADTLLLVSPDKHTTKAYDTSKYGGFPTALPRAGLVVIDTDPDGYAIIDLVAGTVGIVSVPGCKNVLEVTGAVGGSFVVACAKGPDFVPALIRIKR